MLFLAGALFCKKQPVNRPLDRISEKKKKKKKKKKKLRPIW